MIPATPDSEIRGVGEMYPLNGPTWSLFFEYIGTILYALFIRKFSTRALTVLVILAGCGLATFAIFGPYGDICAGFQLTGTEFTGGFLRLLFSFSAGLLLCRLFKPINIKGAFWLCSLSIVVLLSVPRIGGAEHLWMNGLYDTLYMVHYPFIYAYYAWVKNENLTFSESLPGALALVIGSIVLAYACLKFYDEPIRRYLTKIFLRRKE